MKTSACIIIIFALISINSAQQNPVCEGTLDNLITQLNGTQYQAESSSCACACASSKSGTSWKQPPPPTIHIDMSSLLHNAVQQEVTAQNDQLIFRLGAQDQNRVSLFNRDNLELVKLANRTYFFSKKQQFTWTDAASFCRFYGMDLISLETKEEDQRVLQHLRTIGLGTDSKGVFTSASQIGSSEFRWFNGQSLTYSNWSPGEPNLPDREHCMIYWKSAWADFPCTSLAYFACEDNAP